MVNRPLVGARGYQKVQSSKDVGITAKKKRAGNPARCALIAEIEPQRIETKPIFSAIF